jgi:hypothetical protein
MAQGRPPRKKVALNAVLGYDLDSSEDELSLIVTAASSFVSTGSQPINQPPPISTSTSSTSHITIVPPIVEDSQKYRKIPGENVVRMVIQRKGKERGVALYKTRFEDGHIEKVSIYFNCEDLRIREDSLIWHDLLQWQSSFDTRDVLDLQVFFLHTFTYLTS